MSMRYQRVSSPDCVPLSSGKKSNINGRILHTTTNIPGARTNVSGTGCSTLEGKGFRFRSPSITHDHNNLEAAAPAASPHSENHHHDSPPPPPPPPAKNHQHDRSPSPSASASPSPSPSPSRGGGGGGGGSGDMLLQWGQRKRARVSRSEIRALTDDSSSSSSSVAIKAQRRLAPAASTMPPPPPPPPPLPRSSTYTSTSNATTRPRREASAFLSHRNLEERSGSGGSGSPSRNGGSGSRVVVSRSTAGKRSPPPEKVDRKMISCSGSGAVKDEKPNGCSDRANHVDSGNQAHSEQEAGPTNTAAPLAGGGEKVNVELTTEWPRIYIALSRKEKEDDFLAMKGTKLSQRPKKRAKNIDKALQYCFPGMWLSDLTRNRYEVREKKCVKKQKRRGLKGMESLESDSE